MVNQGKVGYFSGSEVDLCILKRHMACVKFKAKVMKSEDCYGFCYKFILLRVGEKSEHKRKMLNDNQCLQRKLLLITDIYG